MLLAERVPAHIDCLARQQFRCRVVAQVSVNLRLDN
jgi:hypothetical protein